MTITQRLGAAFIATLVAVSAAALADTSTNSPGSACVAAGAGSLNARSDGEAENTSAQAVTAVCPADRPVGTGGTSNVSGTVFVVDQSTTGNVCCRIMSKNASDAVVQSAQVCSTGNSASYQVLSLPQISDPFTYSHYFVQCTVPPINGSLTSRIQMYRTTQN